MADRKPPPSAAESLKRLEELYTLAFVPLSEEQAMAFLAETIELESRLGIDIPPPADRRLLH
jgi:hypothetical protein